MINHKPQPANLPNDRRRVPWIAILVTGLPLGLFIGGGIAVWMHLQRDDRPGAGQEQIFGQTIDEKRIAEDLGKVLDVIGERNFSSDSARSGLETIHAMVEGSLGPANTGLNVLAHTSGGPLPLLEVVLPGKSPTAAPLWVMSSLDSPPGSPGAESNASGLVATMAALRELAKQPSQRPVHFVFVPHAADPEAPRQSGVDAVRRLISAEPVPRAVFWVRGLGGSPQIAINAAGELPSAIASRVPKQVRVLSTTDQGSTDPTGYQALLQKSEIPAIAITADPPAISAADDLRFPPPRPLAAAARSLVELLRAVDE